MKTKSKTKGFSLIELLITLIIVSLVVAAFTPVITKKLASTDISMGGSGGNGGSGNGGGENGGGSSCNVQNCSVCLTETICYKCNPYYFSDDGECVSCESLGLSQLCTKCDSTGCKECEKGYRLTGEGISAACEPCHVANCNDCTTNIDTCDLCENGYHQNSDDTSCISCSSEVNEETNSNGGFGEHCIACTKNNCSRCDKGYLLSKQTPATCIDCPTGCGSCYYSGENLVCNADGCSTNYYFNSDNSTCEKCSAKFQGCYRCTKDKCLECTGCADGQCKEDGCQECEPGYTFKNNECIPCTKTRTYDKNGNLISENNGLYRGCAECNANGCIKCVEHCGSPYGGSENTGICATTSAGDKSGCKKCDSGYHYDGSIGQCVKCNNDKFEKVIGYNGLVLYKSDGVLIVPDLRMSIYRYNVGDECGPPAHSYNPLPQSKVSHDEWTSIANESYNTQNPCTTEAGGSYYNGCTRTLHSVSWAQSRTACENIGWRVPSLQEAQYTVNTANGIPTWRTLFANSVNGLNWCASNETNKFIRCQGLAAWEGVVRAYSMLTNNKVNYGAYIQLIQVNYNGEAILTENTTTSHYYAYPSPSSLRCVKTCENVGCVPDSLVVP